MNSEKSLATTLKMLIILYRFEGYLTRYELAEILGVTHRQISRYRDSLINIGVNLKTKPGANGGYYIDECPFCSKTYNFLNDFEQRKMKSIKIEKDEKSLEMEKLIKFLQNENSFLKKEVKRLKKKQEKDLA